MCGMIDSAVTSELTEELVSEYQVVVLTDSSLEEQLKLNDCTHKKDIKFIVAETRGLFSQVGRSVACERDGLSDFFF